MATFYTVSMPDGSSRQVLANSQAAANNNAGLSASGAQPAASSTPAVAQVAAVVSNPSTPGSNGGAGSLTAADGQTLGSQDPSTQATFRAVYGDNAEQAWVQQHNQAVGANTYGAQSGTTSTGPAPTPTPQPGPTTSGADIQAAIAKALQPLQDAFAKGSGFSIQQLEEQKREFDATLAQTQAQMQAIGIPQLVINQQIADAQIAFQQGTLELTKQQQAANLSGMQANGQPTETAREFNQQNSLAQGQLGLSYATQAANFAASNPFELSDFMRGAAQNPDVPRYLQNLQNNIVQGSGATVGPDAAPAIRFGDVATNLAGGGTGYSQTDPAQQAITGIYQRGADALAPGTLESLTPDELTNLQQGINQGYGSAAGPAFLQAYRNNPVRSQTAATTGYMAA